jgi:hypothetical protein
MLAGGTSRTLLIKNDKDVFATAQPRVLWAQYLNKNAIGGGKSHLPDEWHDPISLMHCLTGKVPENSFSAAQALQHPFMENAKKLRYFYSV